MVISSGQTGVGGDLGSAISVKSLVRERMSGCTALRINGEGRLREQMCVFHKSTELMRGYVVINYLKSDIYFKCLKNRQEIKATL